MDYFLSQFMSVQEMNEDFAVRSTMAARVVVATETADTSFFQMHQGQPT